MTDNLYFRRLKPFFMAGKNQLLRMMVLDAQLRHEHPRTMAQLISACMSKESYKFGRYVDEKVSDRTIRKDLSFMREEFGAPIPGRNDDGYQYTDRSFSIFQSPLMRAELEVLKQVGGFLAQFTGLGLSDELKRIIAIANGMELEIDANAPTALDMGLNADQKGNEWLKSLYQAIVSRTRVKVEYQPFVNPKEISKAFEPYLLKQYNKRWFVLGKSELRPDVITNYALDRITAVKPAKGSYEIPANFHDKQFNEIIGVTFYKDNPILDIKLQVAKPFAFYIRTKPMHHKQKEIGEDEKTITFGIKLRINNELIASLMSFGRNIIKIEPEVLRNRLNEEVNDLAKNLSEKS